jgi:predicted RNA methylase
MTTLPLFPDSQTTEQPFDVNSWETPDSVAQKMAALVLPSDRRILEPAAGTGQIATAIQQVVDTDATSLVAIELKPSRLTAGQQRAFLFYWYQLNFISPNFERYTPGWREEGFHLIITNPPFDLALQFLERSLELLDRSYEHARLLYLLPCDVFQSKARGDYFKRLDCHIHHRYLIQGRVAYLKNGVAVSGRQISDCLYDIRPGRQGASETFL